MPIQFICPNGHPLSAPSKKAGKPGRCPKCDVAYVTPTGDDGQVDTSAVTDVVADDAGATFEFLCPNGHKIKAAEEVSGQKAKCPECGELFRVPDHSSNPAEEASSSAVDGDSVEPGAVPGEAALAEVRAGWSVPADMLKGEHGMAEMLEWMWDQKESGVSVEIHLRDGSVMQADYYARELSSPKLGVFGVRSELGQIELTAIQWDAVATARIICDAEAVEGLLGE
jgi:hypothetical protein